MLTGLNTEIQHQGESYHVQTEDGGMAHPVITTLLFKGGAIFFSKKTNYGETISSEAIRQLMKEQHKGVLKELITGKLPSARARTLVWEADV